MAVASLASGVASGESRLPAPRVVKHGGNPALTSISHTIYVNSCLPNGCDLTYGDDDAANHVSSIALRGSAHVSGWKYGDAKWQQLIQCAKDTYSPFDVKIVTDRPASGRYSEIIVAGSPTELFDCTPGGTGQDACPGGLAPFIDCDGATDNAISFMFAGDEGNLNYLCGGIAQETSHVFGLDHELNANDPMTYLNLGSHKVFQDDDANCGESLANPRTCKCGGTTQNSVRYLMSMFGPLVLTPASMSFETPVDGQYVKPGFAIRPKLDDQLGIMAEKLVIDGAEVSTITTTPFDFTAPALAGGDHTISVTATDKASPPRDVTGQVTVHVLATCDAGCGDGTSCVAGLCYPGQSVAGGIGATCANNPDCISGQCASDGTTSICTDSCTPNDNSTCPSGMECLQSGATAVCFPGGSSGGCNAGGGTGGLVMLAFAGLVLRRRQAQ